MTQPSPPLTSPLFRYRFADIEFDEAALTLRRGGQVVDIEQRPLQVLAELLRRPNEVVTKEELFELIWAGRPTVDNVLANAMTKLRKALGDAGDRVNTLPRIGYRFSGPLERLAVGRQVDSQLDFAAGAAVPAREHFLLETQLAPSRSSEVWLARHAKTRELRVYKFSSDGEKLSLLKREATLYRVLAETLGERDDIVRIIDWNFASAPFFLECEYGGTSLRDWADDADRLPAMPVADRLGLFQQIAGAVAAAHSVGVLHKDLKPANVLIAPHNGTWRVRLTDFGSGRLLSPQRLTELGITELGMTVTQGPSGSSSGTPLYLAPELIAGQPPTIQSDVYALGLMLYQLVIGDLRKPMAPGWEADIADELLREDIAAATDGNPGRRLASVTELIERLSTHRARRETAKQRRDTELRAAAAERALDRTRARRPLVVAALGCLSLGMALSLWFYAQAAASRNRLEREVRISRVLNEFMTRDLIGAANPSTSGRTGVTVVDATKSALPSIEARFAEAPDIRAALHQATQEALAGLADYAAAVEEGRKAVEAHLESRPLDVLGLSESRIRLGYALSKLGQSAESKDVLDAAAADVQRLAGAHPDTQIRYWEAQSELALNQLDIAKAVVLDKAAWKLMQTLTDAAPPFRERIEFNLANSLMMNGNFADSETLLRDLIAQQNLSWGAGHWKTRYTQVVLANALVLQKRYDEAAQDLPEVIADIQKGLGESDRRVLMAKSVLANVLVEQQRYAEALPIYRSVHDTMARQAGEHNQAVINFLAWVAITTHYAGHADQAEPIYRQVLQSSETLFGEDTPPVMLARYRLADDLLDLHRFDEAASLLDGLDHQQLANNTSIENDVLRAMVLYDQARLQLARRRPGDALALLERSLPLLTAERQALLNTYRQRDGDLLALAHQATH